MMLNGKRTMRLQIDLNINLPQDKVPPWAKTILDQLGQIMKKEDRIMVNVQDIQTKADATLANVKAETDVVNAVKLVVENSNAMIATLKQQLADAIANGADPTALQALSDTLDAIETSNTSNTQTVADAVAAGTPAANP